MSTAECNRTDSLTTIRTADMAMLFVLDPGPDVRMEARMAHWTNLQNLTVQHLGWGPQPGQSTPIRSMQLLVTSCTYQNLELLAFFMLTLKS